MKTLIIGDQSNKEMYRLIELLETHALKTHTYMVDTTDESELTENDILPDEYPHMLGPDADPVLEMVSGTKRRVTTQEAIDEADIITVTPEQLEEIAGLLPDDDLKIILVMEKDIDVTPEEEIGEFDRRLQTIFETFTGAIAEKTHASRIMKYDAQSMDETSFTEYIANNKRAHDNLRSIIWKLVDMGNVTFAGEVDVNGKPINHNKRGQVVQFTTTGTEYVPIDRFTATVMYDDEALASTMRIWLNSGVTVSDFDMEPTKEEPEDEME